MLCFLCFCWEEGLDGSYLDLLGGLASLGPPRPPVDLPRLAGIRSRPIFVRDLGKIVFGLPTPEFHSDGNETIIKQSDSKFCIFQLRQRVKRSSWSIFMAQIPVFLLACITSLCFRFGSTLNSSEFRMPCVSTHFSQRTIRIEMRANLQA